MREPLPKDHAYRSQNHRFFLFTFVTCMHAGHISYEIEKQRLTDCLDSSRGVTHPSAKDPRKPAELRVQQSDLWARLEIPHSSPAYPRHALHYLTHHPHHSQGRRTRRRLAPTSQQFPFASRPQSSAFRLLNLQHLLQCLAEIGPAAALLPDKSLPLVESCTSSRFCRLHALTPDGSWTSSDQSNKSRFESTHHLGLVSPDYHDLISQDLSFPPSLSYLLSMPSS